MRWQMEATESRSCEIYRMAVASSQLRRANSPRYLGLGDDVEGASGLVGDQQRRTVQHRHGDEHALRLSYTQLRSMPAEEIFIARQAHACHRRRDARLAVVGGTSDVRLPGLAQLGADAQRRVQRGEQAVQHQADLLAAHRAQLARLHLHQVPALEIDAARGLAALQLQQPQDGQRQGALAGTALPDQPEYFSLSDLQKRIAQHRRLVAIASSEAEGEKWPFTQDQCLLAVWTRMLSVSMFQYVCGRSTTGLALATVAETAESAFLLTR